MAEHFIPNRQPLRRVERLEIIPRDFQATVRFWRRLGFKVTIQGDFGSRSATLRAGELRVRLLEDPAREADRRRAPFPALRIAISVRGFDDYLQSLRDKGVEVPEPTRQHGFQRASELVDPDGIRILLEEPAG